MQYSSADSFHGFLIAAAALNLATCPFTVLLNALIMVAVKTKRRLQTHPNILLACLSLTDLMVGFVVQPLQAAITFFLLQGKDAHEFCDIHFAFGISFVLSIFAMTSHLVLISAERYLALKRTFRHAAVVTKARLVTSSSLVWITAPLYFLGILHFPVAKFVYHAAIISLVISLQVLVYKEARRHEKQILSLQVSMETRAKFRQEKKALKLTTIILVKMFLCFSLPSITVVITFFLLRDQSSPDLGFFVGYLSRLLVISSSVFNPVIYAVSKRQFRVACIELILRKSFQDAKQFDKKLFGSRDNAVRTQNEQEDEKREQNSDNPTVPTSGINRDKNTFTPLGEPLSSNALTRQSK